MLTPVSPGMPGRINTNGLEEPLKQLVEAAVRGDSLAPIMANIVASFGFDSFLYAMTTVSRPDRDSRAFCWTNLPDDWVNAYEANSYIEVDPRVTATADSTSPFIWDSNRYNRKGRVRSFLDHAATYGIKSGVVCAFCDASRARMGVMFNSSISPVTKEREDAISKTLGAMMLFSARFHDLFMASFVQRGFPPFHRGKPLSPRERQCLTMAARGLTSADIGLKLGITERTANFHFSNILSKLDVLNRHEAIAKAVSYGAISAQF